MTSTELFLSGDVMLGRGIDQILSESCPPELHEPYVRSATEYVESAERVSGPIPRPAPPEYVWGTGLTLLERRRPDVRIINLETAVTTSEDAVPKGINYRMHPGNVDVLAAAAIDCCVLANNHVLDWSTTGLSETLEVLGGAGIVVVGAGRDMEAAARPGVLDGPWGGRVIVLAFCTGDSGVPPGWAAGPGAPGVNRLADLSSRTVEAIGRDVAAVRREGDLVVVSIHWGGNWGYAVPRKHRRFAQALVDRAGVDAVHGHSSHHPKGIEVYQDRPILYGCGDLINDYEGIPGRDEYRGDLVLMYFPTFGLPGGGLRGMALAPMRVRGFRLTHPDEADREWLLRRLNRECGRFGTSVEAGEEAFTLKW